MPLYTSTDELIARWGEAYLAHDADALADLYEEKDGVWYVAKLDIFARGRQAIAAAFRERFASLAPVGADPLDRKEQQVGDYAFTHATWELRDREVASGREVSQKIRATEVLHRGADGGWRLLFDHVT